MEGSTIDIVLFAPLAPILGVILFWFLKLLFIESQKYFLHKIRPKHEPLCRFTNFLGILFQSICHALGFTVTKSGISDFYISVNYGRVAPKKEKRGIFEWVANAFLFLGPFFIPAFLLFFCLIFLLPDVFSMNIPLNIEPIKYTFGGQFLTFGTNLYVFAEKLLGFLTSIDFLNPIHFGFFILLIFLGLGIRPSHIGEKKVDKIDIIYDLRNVWNLITHKPLYIILLILFSYNIYYVCLLFNLNFYVMLFSLFGYLSIISIVALLITHLIINLIRATDLLEGFRKYIPYLTLIFSYVIMRTIFFFIPFNYDKGVSIIVMFFTTLTVTFYLISRDDKFKTQLNIKEKKKKDKEEKDGKRGTDKK